MLLQLYTLAFLDHGEESMGFAWDVGTVALGPVTVNTHPHTPAASRTMRGLLQVPLMLAFGMTMQRVGTPDEQASSMVLDQ